MLSIVYFHFFIIARRRRSIQPLFSSVKIKHTVKKYFSKSRSTSWKCYDNRYHFLICQRLFNQRFVFDCINLIRNNNKGNARFGFDINLYIKKVENQVNATFGKITNMKFPSPVSVEWIAELTGAETFGNVAAQATGINEIHRVENGDLCFVDHPKYYNKCLNSAADFIIINTKDVTIPNGKVLLVVREPFEAYLKIVNHFRPFVPSPTAISESATIGVGTVIMPNAFVGNNVSIGSDCVIHPNVTILDYTQIGNNVVIQAGTVIGSDAFYYNSRKDREVWYKRMQSCGNVVVEDNVEIGAGCTIDRGVTADTRIGSGTKMDNQVHIAHDVLIGKNCLFAAQVAIAGGTVLKDGVTLWGQVGISKTLTIGNNVTVLAQSGVGKDLEDGTVHWGSPSEDALTKKRELIWVKRIPELWKKVTEMK
jgi:UDP-3-O-[3-hydroxymyristoyl] glucosamine N-acyltransferase